ncbi:MAG: SCO6745 family protein [Acidimicrobiia bacterium]
MGGRLRAIGGADRQLGGRDGMTYDARAMWRVLEPYHGQTYFAPEALAALTEIGLRGGWMCYFAGRAAPMGAVSPAVVEATFAVFEPGRVARAIPDAWSLATPDSVVEAKLAGASQALRRLLGEQVASSEVTEAASLVRRAADGCDHFGRPLSAAWATVAWPRDDHLALWLGATILREHRGCGHVAALAGAGLDGVEAVVSAVACGGVTQAEASIIGWSESELKAATSRLIDRRWLSAEGRATEEGIAARGRIEDETNRLAASPWRVLGEAGCARLVTLIEPLSAVIASQIPENPFPEA